MKNMYIVSLEALMEMDICLFTPVSSFVCENFQQQDLES